MILIQLNPSCPKQILDVIKKDIRIDQNTFIITILSKTCPKENQ